MTDWIESGEPETNKIKKLNELANYVYGDSYGSSGINGTSGTSGLGIKYLGDWHDFTTYYTNDLVKFNGITYLCLTDGVNTFDPTVQTEFWEIMTIDGTSGVSGSSGISGTSGVSGTSGISSPDVITIYTKTGLTYQISLDDISKYIIFTTGTTIYIPDSGTTNISSGSTIIMEQNGIDQIMVSPLNGNVIINGNLKSANRYNILVLFKTDINTWNCVGGVV